MTNHRLEREMSLYLDGRLPSSRRQALMERISEDFEAARTWESMRRAHQAALEIPQESVSSSFHETLRARIASGEGTPEAVFRPPVPLRTKLRYVGSGAAAAALVIAASYLLGDRTQPEPTRPELEIASVPENVVERDDPRLELRQIAPSSVDLASTDLASRGVLPATPKSAFQVGQTLCIEQATKLKRRLPDLEREIEVVDPDEMRRSLEPIVVEFKSSARVMKWMHDRKMINLPPQVRDEIVLAENRLAQFERAVRAREQRQLRLIIDELKGISVDNLLQRDIMAHCCMQPEEFAQRFMSDAADDPELMRAMVRMNASLSNPTGPTGISAGNGTVIFFHVSRGR